jgi:hypothetical protein
MTIVNNNSPFFGETQIELASQGLEDFNAIFQALSLIVSSDEDH